MEAGRYRSRGDGLLEALAQQTMGVEGPTVQGGLPFAAVHQIIAVGMPLNAVLSGPLQDAVEAFLA